MKALLLLFLLTGVAMADVRIDELLIRRKEGTVNLRVNLSNPSAKTQRGPIKITLYVRPDSQAAWEQVKVWTNISKLAAGNRAARDFFDHNNPRLREIANEPAFEARAVVEAPGYKTQEATGVFHPDP